MDVPLPPLDIANRVGCIDDHPDPWALYEQIGRQTRERLEDLLPDEWTWAGKRILDFGAGAGRTLRHFIAEAHDATFVGCDIHEPSIAWIQENLSPPLQGLLNGAEPPLAVEDSSFDLIYALSVFTHLTDTWAAWLIELHRVLADDGLIVITYMGRNTDRGLSVEDWDEDATGMLVLRDGQSWDLGGPMVLHSDWWIREHWGRAFEVVALSHDGFVTDAREARQSAALLRKVPGAPAPTVEALTTLPADEPRETRALERNLRLVRRELRASHGDAPGSPPTTLSDLRSALIAAEKDAAEVIELRQRVTEYAADNDALRAERQALLERSGGLTDAITAEERTSASLREDVQALLERSEDLAAAITAEERAAAELRGYVAQLEAEIVQWRNGRTPAQALTPRRMADAVRRRVSSRR